MGASSSQAGRVVRSSVGWGGLGRVGWEGLWVLDFVVHALRAVSSPTVTRGCAHACVSGVHTCTLFLPCRASEMSAVCVRAWMLLAPLGCRQPALEHGQDQLSSCPCVRALRGGCASLVWRARLLLGAPVTSARFGRRTRRVSTLAQPAPD